MFLFIEAGEGESERTTCLWVHSEGIRVCGIGVIGGWEPSDMGAASNG